MALLGGREYDSIRAALDIGLTAEDLPDAVIDLPIYSPAAEAEVLRWVPTAETLAAPQRDRAVRAAILFCAGYLAGAAPQIAQDQVAGDARTVWSTFDAAARQEDLLGRAEEQVSILLREVDEASFPFRPRFFTLAPGRRGRSYQ
jgi:hypothetical protein